MISFSIVAYSTLLTSYMHELLEDSGSSGMEADEQGAGRATLAREMGPTSLTHNYPPPLSTIPFSPPHTFSSRFSSRPTPVHPTLSSPAPLPHQLPVHLEFPCLSESPLSHSWDHYGKPCGLVWTVLPRNGSRGAGSERAHGLASVVPKTVCPKMFPSVFTGLLCPDVFGHRVLGISADTSLVHCSGATSFGHHFFGHPASVPHFFGTTFLGTMFWCHILGHQFFGAPCLGATFLGTTFLGTMSRFHIFWAPLFWAPCSGATFLGTTLWGTILWAPVFRLGPFGPLWVRLGGECCDERRHCWLDGWLSGTGARGFTTRGDGQNRDWMPPRALSSKVWSFRANKLKRDSDIQI